MILGLDMDHLLSLYGYFAIFGFVALESLGIPWPGETMLIAAGLYAGHTGNLNPVGIVVVASAAAIIGDNIGYAVGLYGGYRLLRRYGRYVHLDEGRIKLGRYLFWKHGGKVVFFGRFVSVLRTYAAFLAGTNRMQWRKFLVFNAAGGILWATLYGLGSYYLGQSINNISSDVTIIFAVVVVATIVIGFVLLRRNEARLIAKAEAAFPGPLGDNSVPVP